MALCLTALPDTAAAGIWSLGSHQRIQAHLPRLTVWHLIRPLPAEIKKYTFWPVFLFAQHFQDYYEIR